MAEQSLQSVAREGSTLKCPECGSEDVGFRNDEHFCRKCGLVFD